MLSINNVFIIRVTLSTMLNEIYFSIDMSHFCNRNISKSIIQRIKYIEFFKTIRKKVADDIKNYKKLGLNSNRKQGKLQEGSEVDVQRQKKANCSKK